MKTPFASFFLLLSLYSSGQKQESITVPTFKDTYSEYVQKLESGQTDIDYKDFRFSFIESKQFKEAGKKASELSDLKEDMYKQMKKKGL